MGNPRSSLTPVHSWHEGGFVEGRIERGKGSHSSLCVFMVLRPYLLRAGHTRIASSSFPDRHWIHCTWTERQVWLVVHLFFLLLFLLHITILSRPASTNLGIFLGDLILLGDLKVSVEVPTHICREGSLPWALVQGMAHQWQLLALRQTEMPWVLAFTSTSPTVVIGPCIQAPSSVGISGMVPTLLSWLPQDWIIFESELCLLFMLKYWFWRHICPIFFWIKSCFFVDCRSKDMGVQS